MTLKIRTTFTLALFVTSFAACADPRDDALDQRRPGAADLGLNRGFWGYQTGAVVDVLDTLPQNASVYVHDTTYDAFRMLQRDGRLRSDLRPAWSPAGADAALYHHEQHMAGVEQQSWE